VPFEAAIIDTDLIAHRLKIEFDQFYMHLTAYHEMMCTQTIKLTFLYDSVRRYVSGIVLTRTTE